MKKAQAAMEFLMTYGWALLVVLAAIGALAYFGVLSPQKFLPETCMFAPGIACMDFSVTADQVNVLVQNSMGRDIMILSFSAGDCSANISHELGNAESYLITLPCTTGESGSAFRAKTVITYRLAESELVKQNTGNMVAKVP